METNLHPVEHQFSEILQIIEGHRRRAYQYVNQEMLDTYWEVGKYVSRKLQSEEWGGKIVSQLSEYLRKQNPSLKGYKRSSIYNMKLFYETYSSPEFLLFATALAEKNLIFQPEVGKLEKDTLIVQSKIGQIQSIDNQKVAIVQPKVGQLENGKNEIVQPTVGQLTEQDILSFLYQVSWSLHLQILAYCNDDQQRVFYILYAQKERMTKQEVIRALQTDAYTHLLTDKKILSTGMKETYPDAAYEFKDTVFVDFLGLPAFHKESRLQKGIENNIRAFIGELGRDFLFMDSQFPVNVGTKTLKIDLLFFHRGLQCLVAVELKSGEFRAADMGQLELYLEALDRDVKRSNENPSIGIILCRTSDRILVEYAMSRSLSPAMIAEYKQKLIPQNILQQTFEEFTEFLEKAKRKK